MESRGGLKAFADAIGLVKNGSVLCIGVACKQQKPLKWLNISGAFSFLRLNMTSAEAFNRKRTGQSIPSEAHEYRAATARQGQ